MNNSHFAQPISHTNETTFNHTFGLDPLQIKQSKAMGTGVSEVTLSTGPLLVLFDFLADLDHDLSDARAAVEVLERLGQLLERVRRADGRRALRHPAPPQHVVELRRYGGRTRHPQFSR